MSTLRDVKRLMPRGNPIAWVPNAARDDPDFLAWWRHAGQNNPQDAQGWTGISGPGAASNRIELIPDEAWESLPAGERAAISRWIERLGIGVLYD
jgi:hypothetical protein